MAWAVRDSADITGGGGVSAGCGGGFFIDAALVVATSSSSSLQRFQSAAWRASSSIVLCGCGVATWTLAFICGACGWAY